MFWSLGWPLLRAEGFFCNLDILYGGLGIGKLQFLINFWSLKPRIRIGFGSGSGSGLVFSLKCWIRIRIRMKWMRIRNPGIKECVPYEIWRFIAFFSKTNWTWGHREKYTECSICRWFPNALFKEIIKLRQALNNVFMLMRRSLEKG